MPRQFSISGFIRFKDEATEQLKKVGAAIAGLKERGDTFSAGVGNVNGGMKAMAVAGTAVGAGLGIAVSRAANFEESLAILNSVSDLTSGQLEMVKQKSLDLGSSTVFTATEVAGGFTELAKAGLTVEQQMSAIPGVLSAAATEGLGLAQSAEIVVGILQGQNLAMDQAAHVADVLAASAAGSSAGMTDLGEAFKYANGLAQIGALTFEQTAGALAVLANAGLKGSIAGSSLTSMFTQITKPSKKVSQTLANMGMTDRFTDPDTGKLLALPDIIAKIDKATGGLKDDQEKLAFIQDLVGTAGMKAFFALKNGTQDATKETASSYDRMVQNATNASDGIGAAASMAGKRLNSLKGDAEALSGGLDTVTIGVGSMLTPALRTAVQSMAAFVDPIAETIRAVNKPFDALTKKDMDLMSSPMGQFFIGLRIGISETIDTVKSFVATVRAEWAQFAPMFGGSEADLGRFVAKAALFLVAFAPIAATFVATTFAIGTFGNSLKGVGQIAMAVTPKFSTLASAAGSAMKLFRGVAASSILNWGVMMSRLGPILATVQTAVMSFGATLSGLFLNPVGLTILAIVALVAAGYLLYQNWDAVTSFLSTAWTTVAGYVAAGADWIAAKWNNLSNVAKFLALGVMLLTGPIGWVTAGIILLARNWDTIAQSMGLAWDWFTAKVGTAVAGIMAWYNSMDTSTRDMVYTIASYLTLGLLPAFNWLYSNWGAVTSFFSDSWTSMVSAISRIDWGAVFMEPMRWIGMLIQKIVGLTSKIPGASTAFSAFGIDVAGLNQELADMTAARSFLKADGAGQDAPLAKVLPFRPLDSNPVQSLAQPPLSLLGTGTDGPTLGAPVSTAVGGGFGNQITGLNAATAAVTQPQQALAPVINLPQQPPIEVTSNINVNVDSEVLGRAVAKQSVKNGERRGTGLGPDSKAILRNGPIAGKVGVD